MVEMEQQVAATGSGRRKETVYQLPAVAWTEHGEAEASSTGPQTELDASTVAVPRIVARTPHGGGPDGRLEHDLRLPVAGASSAGADGTATAVPPAGELSEAPTLTTEIPEADDAPVLSAGSDLATGEVVAALPFEGHPKTAAKETPGRISKSMIAAAGTAGVVLIGLPLVLSQLGGHGPGPSPSPPKAPAGFFQPGTDANGFVPSFDDHGSRTAPTVGLGTGLVAATPLLAAKAQAPSGSGATPGESVQAPAQKHATVYGPPSPTRRHSAAPAKKSGSTPKRKAPATKPPAPATYQATAGPWCSNGGTGFEQYAWFDDGVAGWHSYGTGGWTGNGCGGRYTAMPMSGNKSKDARNSTVWTFATGKVSRGRCTISVYIPNNTNAKAVGGKPAYYTVQNQFSPRSGTIGSFKIDQTANRGRWVRAGNFPVSNGRIAVMMHDRGQDWTGTTKTYAHDAASAVRANCSA